MVVSGDRPWRTECLLISLLLSSVPNPSLCRQQVKSSDFAARPSTAALETNPDGVRDRRSVTAFEGLSGSSCCVCSVAIYRATFTSKWNKNTHPNDYPEKLAHFSSVVGGTHRGDHIVWKLGSKASAAVKRFSEWGDTRSLLNRVTRRQFLGIIRTAPVHSDKPVSDRFRADKVRHYLSILSKITPSPDWFVGIDRFDLCNSTSCSWKRNVTIQLTPIDAGTDSGLKFLATNSRTEPSEPIRRISPNYPNHPDASFFNRDQKSVPAMAEFKVELLQTKGRCSRHAASSAVNCKVSRWSSWTPCSNPCGRGKKERGRVILVRPKNGGKACPKISRVKGCRGRNCTDIDCVVTRWSEWSPCSKTCGKGRRYRRRRVVTAARGGGRRCPRLLQKGKCRMKGCPIIDCRVSNWTNWSGCSKTCGRGKRRRSRTVNQHPNRGAKCPILSQKQECNVFKCRSVSRLSAIG